MPLIYLLNFVCNINSKNESHESGYIRDLNTWPKFRLTDNKDALTPILSGSYIKDKFLLTNVALELIPLTLILSVAMKIDYIIANKLQDKDKSLKQNSLH